MTREQWQQRAEDHRMAGEPLRIDADEYAELIRVGLAHDPRDMADHTRDLLGVPIYVEGV